jgi:ElaA protein
MQFAVKTFHRLTVPELHEIYTLRSKVFVVEQACAYQDPDDKDPAAHHVLMTENGRLIGYARILSPGIAYPQAAIGRVVVEKSHRGGNLGRELMKHCIHQTLELFKDQDIVISAQLHLLRFYTSLGFITEGHDYLEDNIPHIKMRLLYRG